MEMPHSGRPTCENASREDWIIVHSLSLLSWIQFTASLVWLEWPPILNPQYDVRRVYGNFWCWMRRSGSQSLLRFIPKTFLRVKVRTLFKFFHTEFACPCRCPCRAVLELIWTPRNVWRSAAFKQPVINFCPGFLPLSLCDLFECELL